MMQPTDSTRGESSTAAVPMPSPRAFCHATGYVYQSIGFFLCLGMCCWWPANCWQDQLPRATTVAATMAAADQIDPAMLFSSPTPRDQWAMFAVTLTFIGGLLLIMFGFGLQQDRLRSARGPLILTGILGSFFWCYLGFAVFQFPSAGAVLVSAVGGLGWTAMFLLAGASHRQLRAAPPRPFERSWTSHDEDAFRKSLSPGSRDRTSP